MPVSTCPLSFWGSNVRATATGARDGSPSEKGGGLKLQRPRVVGAHAQEAPVLSALAADPFALTFTANFAAGLAAGLVLLLIARAMG